MCKCIYIGYELQEQETNLNIENEWNFEFIDNEIYTVMTTVEINAPLLQSFPFLFKNLHQPISGDMSLSYSSSHFVFVQLYLPHDINCYMKLM